jgi:CxxC motif-containing protein (DUF1111 family)
LHDGRTNDLLQAILAHRGEASQVILNFNGLSCGQKQDLLNFFRGLSLFAVHRPDLDDNL